MALENQSRQMIITEDELKLIKDTYKGNERLVKLLRKMFLPAYDPEAPITGAIDPWLMLPLDQMTQEEGYRAVYARNLLIQYLEDRFRDIYILANREEKTPEQIAENAKKNSSV